MKYFYENEAGINPKEHYPWLEDAGSRKKKFAKQRSLYGFDERQIWNLDYTLVAFLYPRLKFLYLNTPVDWAEDGLSDMFLKAFPVFESYLATDDPSKELKDEVRESLVEIAENFDSLWW